jgi:stage V sporulation protein R
MRSLRSEPKLQELKERVEYFAHEKFNMTLPEMRFFILDPLEFASLLEKNVYPTSPINIWEGKKIANKKHRIETGQESALYYEVVQTGNPSYAYLNETNSALTQASVMAHVAGHCEFSELNVLHDSDFDRTEYVMYLSRKVDLARRQMGERRYTDYWNAAESVLPFIAPNSQYNLENSVDKESTMSKRGPAPEKDETPKTKPPLELVSDTLNSLLKFEEPKPFVEAEKKRDRQEALSRKGYNLRAPCQDILGFLREYAPTSKAERAILDYLYVAHQHQDFVIRTQIMNEGWAMYWEKKIMMELFAEDSVRGAIDYAKVFSGVCYPRPYFQRNPYHLGYHMWQHIEELYREGKMSLAYHEEKDLDTKTQWSKEAEGSPQEYMRHLVRTITDYEFLRRFLTPELIERFHLNRLDHQLAQRLGVKGEDVVKADRRWVWLNPQPIKDEMLHFFAHYYRPRIYIIDTNYKDGGLLLMHRDDGRALRADWIRPALNNFNRIWKAPVYLLSKDKMYTATSSGYKESTTEEVPFEEIAERMRKSRQPYQAA